MAEGVSFEADRLMLRKVSEVKLPAHAVNVHPQDKHMAEGSVIHAIRVLVFIFGGKPPQQRSEPLPLFFRL